MQDKWIKIAEAAVMIGYKTRSSACSVRGWGVWARNKIRVSKRGGTRWMACLSDVKRVMSLGGAK